MGTQRDILKKNVWNTQTFNDVITWCSCALSIYNFMFSQMPKKVHRFLFLLWLISKSKWKFVHFHLFESNWLEFRKKSPNFSTQLKSAPSGGISTQHILHSRTTWDINAVINWQFREIFYSFKSANVSKIAEVNMYSVLNFSSGKNGQTRMGWPKTKGKQLTLDMYKRKWVCCQ